MKQSAAFARLAAIAALAAVGALPARSSEPGPYEPPASGYGPAVPRWHGREAAPPAIRPPRRVTGGPGYVGSDWGLGKPSYYGIGTRPDWGRSSVD